MNNAPVILASGSAIRAQILTAAGVDFRIERPQVDEDVLKRRHDALADGALALKLAEEKAAEVSRRHAALCLGADQILTFEGRRYDKAGTMAEARTRLLAMRGKPHELICGAALAKDGDIVWTHLARSRIQMRDYSEEFLDAYLAEAGVGILKSVACYQFEGLGAQLFESVDADYYSVLGLPLLPVLDGLRSQGALKT